MVFLVSCSLPAGVTVRDYCALHGRKNEKNAS